MTLDEFLGRYAYWMTTILMIVGIWGMLGKRNMMKKLIGMNIFQSAVILFFVSGATKFGATLPVRSEELGTSNPDLYANPLPHTLMLTAIVVSVATTGVALSILQAIYRRYQTLDEVEVLEQIEEGP